MALPVATSGETLSITSATNLKLVKYLIGLIEILEQGMKVVVQHHRLHGTRFHIHVPDLHGQIVSGKDETTIRRVSEE